MSSIPVKGSDNATYQVQQASLGEVDKTLGVGVTLATNGNHAKSTDISTMSAAITGALAPSGGLPVAFQGTVAVTQSGAWTVGLSPGATVALAGGNTVALKVDGSSVTQPVSGTVSVGSLPALPAGTSKIGSVDIGSLPALPAGTSKIGSVDIASLPATAAKDATLSAAYGTLADTATTDIAANGASKTFSSLFQGMVANLLALTKQLPASLGAKLSAASLSVAPATDAQFIVAGAGGALKVGGSTARAFSTFTRPANTTAYALGQLVANSTTAGSVTPIPLTVARVNGGSCAIPTLKLSKSSANVTNASFRIHLYRNAPTASNGDGGVWLTTSSIYLGYADITMDKVFTDEVSGTGVVKDTAGNPRTLLTDTAAGSQSIYALIEARGAYPPASAETFTLTAEVSQD